MLAMLRALHSFLADAPKRVQAELFSADPMPDIRRELQEILELLK